LKLSNDTNLLESKVTNKIRLRESSTQTEFQVLRLILTQEKVEKLKNIVEILENCDESLTDGVKLG